MVSGAPPRPGGEARGGPEARHLPPDLGDQRLGRPVVNARHRAQEVHRPRERGQHTGDLGRERGDDPLEELELSEHRADEKGVRRAETAVERRAQRGELLAERPPGELGERLWVLAARDERVEHRTPGSRTTSSAGCSMRATCGTSPAARPTWRTPYGLASSSSMGECARPAPRRSRSAPCGTSPATAKRRSRSGRGKHSGWTLKSSTLGARSAAPIARMASPNSITPPPWGRPMTPCG